MASMYESILPTLPDVPPKPDEAKRVARVSARKVEILEERDAGGSPVAWTAEKLAVRYALRRGEADVLDAKLAIINLELEALERMLIDSYQAEEDGWGDYGATAEMLRLVSGDSVRVHREPYLVVEDREIWRQHCLKDPDLARIMAVPWNKGNELLKARLLAGQPPFPGTGAFKKWKIVFTEKKEK